MTSSAAWIRTGRGQRSRGQQCEVTRRSCVLLMDVCVFFIREKEEDEMLTSVIQRMGKERPSFSFSLTVL